MGGSCSAKVIRAGLVFIVGSSVVIIPKIPPGTGDFQRLKFKLAGLEAPG